MTNGLRYDLNTSKVQPTGTSGDAAKVTLADLAAEALLRHRGHGQVRMTLTSLTNLVALPYGGRWVVINGIAREVPGPYDCYVDTTGLDPDTTYYAYLWYSTLLGRVRMTLSETGHGTSYNGNNSGIETKTGDDDFSLIGMVHTGTSAKFIPNVGYCQGYANWFNRRRLYVSTGGGLSLANDTATEADWEDPNTGFWWTNLCKYMQENNAGTGWDTPAEYDTPIGGLCVMQWGDSSFIGQAQGIGRNTEPDKYTYLLIGTSEQPLFGSTSSTAGVDLQNMDYNQVASNGEGFFLFTLWGTSQEGGSAEFFIVPGYWSEY